MKKNNKPQSQKTRLKTPDIKQKSPRKKKKNYNRFYYLAAILLLTAVLFSGIISNDFVSWDDDGYVINSEIIRDISSGGIKNIFTSYVLSNYHPLTVLLYAIEFKAFGLSASGYHYVSLLLHLINIILIFYLFIHLGFKERIALFVALLFAVHPMHVESVAWIAEQKDLLYSLFFIASLISYLFWIKNEKSIKWLAFSILFFVLSLLSKSMAVTLPLVLILIDWYYGRIKSRKAIIEKLPFVALSVFFGILAIVSQSEGHAMDIVPDISIIDRFFLTCYAIVFYIFKLIVPVNLSALYFYPVKSGSFLPFYYYLMPLIVIAIIYLICKIKSNRKIILFGSLFFLATITVVLQVIPVGGAIVAERYTYLPYLGLFLIVSFYFDQFLQNKRSVERLRKWIYTFSVVYLCFLCVITYQRIKLWEDGVSLFSDVLKKNPNDYRSYVVLANSYFAKGNLSEALNSFDKALELNDQHMDSYMNRGMVRMQMGKLSEAIEDYNRVIELDPDYSQAYTNKGIVYMRMEDHDKALAEFDKALTANPEDVICLTQQAQLFFDQGKTDDAFAGVNKAISIKPSYSTAYSKRGYFYAQTGRYSEAENDLKKAIELDPRNSDNYLTLGNIRSLMEDLQGAIAEFDKAIKANQFNAAAYNNRGIVKLRLGLNKGACDDLSKAANLGHAKAMELFRKYCE